MDGVPRVARAIEVAQLCQSSSIIQLLFASSQGLCFRIANTSEKSTGIMSLQQAQAEGLCLKYPEPLGPHPQITQETAVHMLQRAIQLSQHTPFAWGYIDKPLGMWEPAHIYVLASF